MSFAYLPLYTGDYIRDTQHLSCSEHGIFLKLLMHCWDQKGPAPLDERKLCGIVNARSSDEIEALRRILAEFFVRMEDGHYNKRMQQEIQRCEAISEARSGAGRAGANERMRRLRANAKQMPSNCVASDKQVTLSPSPSPSLTPVKNSEAKASGAVAPVKLTADEVIFTYGVPLLVNAGSPEKQARSFLGGLRKSHGDDAVVNALRECIRAKPLQPLEWLAGALKPKVAGKQTAIESRNAALVARLIKESENAAE